MDILESNKIEFKAKYNDQIIREIVSFINADGGKIYIGIEDNGNVIGASKIDETLINLSNIITSQIEPNAIDLVSPEIQIIDGKPVVVIIISFPHPA